MDTVVISPAFQVRIPKHVRDALGLVPGQCMRLVRHAGHVELVPLRPAFECAALSGTARDTGEPTAPPQQRRQRA